MCVSMYSLEHVQSHVETVPYVSVHIMYGPVLLEYVAAPLRPAPLDPDGSTCHEMSGGLSVARGTTRSATSTHCAATKTKGTWCFVARLFCKCIKRCGLFLATDGSVADMVMRHSHAAIRYLPIRGPTRHPLGRVAVHCCGCGSAFLDSASSATMVVRGGLRDVVTRGWF